MASPPVGSPIDLSTRLPNPGVRFAFPPSSAKKGGGVGTNPPVANSGPYLGGGQPQFGGRMGGLGGYPTGPTSDPKMVAQFWPSAKINPDSLPKGTNGAWRCFDVDRPTILVVSQAILVDQFFYGPERIGDCATVTGGVSVPAPSTNTVRGDQVFAATRHGCCYFSAPGRWWVYNPSSTVDYQVWLIDASDVSVAQRYLNESGSCSFTNTTNVTVSNLSSTIIVQANRSRSATIIQHTGRDGADAATTNDVYLAFEATAVLAQGMYLAAGQTISLQGEINFRGRIRGIARTGSVKVAITEVVS